jgi:deoxyribodipyrimidine photo-lyase
MKQIDERVQLLNDKPENNDGEIRSLLDADVQAHDAQSRFEFAIEQANERKLPLVVYEGLKFYYPWASDRFHTYILEGVEEKRHAFEKLGIKYVFYLQKDEHSPKQTVARIATRRGADRDRRFSVFYHSRPQPRDCRQSANSRLRRRFKRRNSDVEI